jgi:hypothetical protein
MNMTLELDKSFTHNFECNQVEGRPGVLTEHYYYPDASTEGGRDGLVVQVSPRVRDPWIGTFAFGTVSPKAKNGLYSWPDPQIVCVVSKGQAYLVRVDEPTSYKVLNVDPVLDVIPIGAKNIVVFANYTELFSYGKSGPVWVSDRLSWDGIKITRVSDDYIEGEVWDPSVEANVAFKVDLSNGSNQT